MNPVGLLRSWVLAYAEAHERSAAHARRAPRGFRLDAARPDAAFRASDVWARRDAVVWDEDPGALLDRPIAYVDQLAVRGGGPGARRWGAAVALRAALDALPPGGALVATTVEAPLVNLAAVPYLRRVGARRFGQIDEDYPGIGAIRSAVWAAPAEAVYARMAAPRGLAEAWVVAAVRQA